MQGSMRIIDKNESDCNKSLAVILPEYAYDKNGNYSGFTNKVIAEARAKGKNPIVIENWSRESPVSEGVTSSDSKNYK